VTTWLSECGLCKSRGEARKMVEAGAVTLNDEKITISTRLSPPNSSAADGLLPGRARRDIAG
jgi:ribosomal 50S subunit-recycling heat shock protein